MKHTAAVLTVIVGFVAGCGSWRGELDRLHNQRVADRIRDLAPMRLQTRSTAPPTPSPDGIADLAVRRAPVVDIAADPHRLSIAEMRRQCLRTNLDLDIALFDPALADARVAEEEAKFDPIVSGRATYRRKRDPELDGDLVKLSSDSDTLDGNVVKLTAIEQTKEMIGMEAAIAVPLATGGRIKLLSFLDENDKLSPQRFEQFVSGVKFSISQPLLRNAGVGVNTASIRVARLDAQAVQARTKLTALRLLVGAETAYWRLYEAYQVLKIRETQYNTAFDNLELVRKRVDQGLSPRIEVVRAEVGVAARLESLIIAETRFRLTQRDVKRILNSAALPMDAPAVIQVTSDPQIVRFDLDAEQVIQDALDNRLELLELELALAADAVRVDVARNQMLPELVVDIEYAMLDRRGSFGTSWEEAWDFENDAFAVGVYGEIPLTNAARRSRLRQALLQRGRRLATKDQRELVIRQEVSDALDILGQNWQRILAARQNVIVSGINYEAELRQFEEGLRTMREVLEALASLGDAQLQEVRAMVAYQIAQIDVAFATGGLLAYDTNDTEPLPIDYDRVRDD